MESSYIRAVCIVKTFNFIHFHICTCNCVAILAVPKLWFAKSYFCIYFLVIQIPVVVGVPLPMRSYFHSATKKVWDHLKAWWRDHHLQFTGAQVLVQYLVEGMTFALLTMPTVTLTPTPTLATLTLFQVEYKTRTQSWLGLTNSHLMRWRCFILAESQNAATQFYWVPDVSITFYNLCHEWIIAWL